MRRRIWLKTIVYISTAALTLTGAGLAYLAMSRFTYYDNGTWMQSSLLEICAKSQKGYGRDPIEERLLKPNWGASASYAARNFTLDLAGLDYSLPLSWQDTVLGQGMWVMRPPKWWNWQEVALYPSDITVSPGEKLTVEVQLAGTNGLTVTQGRIIFDRAYLLTLHRPWFSYVAYVTDIRETEPSVIAANIGDVDGANSVARRHLEAVRDYDYEAWVSTMAESSRPPAGHTGGIMFSFDSVVVLAVDEVRVSVERTLAMRENYSGSELVRNLGWSDEHVAENMVVVFTQYLVDYDIEAPFTERTVQQYWFLVREDRDSPWLVWEADSPVVLHE